jgi:putative ABC transport system permease protein
MKYFPLIWTGLWRKPVRTGLTFLSLAAVFLLFGSLYGINAGFDRAIERINSNRLIVYCASYGPALPIGYRAQIQQIPGVVSTMISTTISGYYQQPLNLLYVGAIGGDIHLDVFGEIENVASLVNALQARRTGALVGRELARKYGWKVGDRVALITGPQLNQDGSDFMEFDIVGIYDVPNDPESAHWFLLNYDYLEGIRVKAKGTTNELYVDTPGPARNEEVADSIDRHFENSALQTYTETLRNFQRALFNQALDMKLIVTVIIFASMFALLILSANTLMQSVRQRLPEIAVLKALGYSQFTVTLLVVIESILLCTSAALLGLLVATLIFPKIAAAVHVPAVRMPLQAPAIGILIALFIAVVSAVLPALRARRLSVASVLAGN